MVNIGYSHFKGAIGLIKSASIVTETTVRQLWKSEKLGDIEQIIKPKRGSINPCFIVNDSMVVRFTTDTDKGGDRFESEAAAYQQLKNSGVPVPAVIKLDTSRKTIPYAYLITSKLAGETVIDSWATFTPEQRQDIAFAAGKYLAMIHQSTTYSTFGNLRDLPNGGFSDWHDYVWDFYRRYARQALTLKAITPKLEARIHAVILRHKPTLDTITQGALIHSDYHFENILQKDGEITGIIDFEWAYSGDPLADFIVDGEWEKTCPDSRKHVLKGYTSLRPLGKRHEIRLNIYKLLWHLETVMDYKKAKNEADYQTTLKLLTDVIAVLETTSAPPS